jgi:hypothetical protein
MQAGVSAPVSATVASDDQQKHTLGVLVFDEGESGVGGRSRAADGLVAVGAFRPCFGGAPVGLGGGQLLGREAGGDVDAVGLDHGGAGLDEDLVVDADRPQPVIRGTLVGAVPGVREGEPGAVEGEGLELPRARKGRVHPRVAAKVRHGQRVPVGSMGTYIGDPALGVAQR